MKGASSSQEKSCLLTFKDGLPLYDNVFIQEIQDLIEKGVIERYGREEFERIILTHEIHGHIGVYTLIGTKMGLYARELLDAPRNAMTILSECGGGEFPIRCVNDGLVVSTGCSPLFGKIELDESKSNCAVRFTHKDKVIRLQLKKSYQEELQRRIADAVKKYKIDGVLTGPYWEEVIKLTWWAWEEWERKSIFDVEWIKK